uniref:Uncharacterized protein n=1 Tax=Tetranychus urticae TaxID=32264 RepID=T1KF16_TETUR
MTVAIVLMEAHGSEGVSQNQGHYRSEPWNKRKGFTKDDGG